MSLTIESYKLVGRNYLQRLLDQTNEDCGCSNCTFCVRGKLIQAERFKNGYQTFNKDVQCWKISESASSLSVSPSDQWFFAVVKPDFFKKEYVWSFRDYRNGVELSMNLQEVIDSTNELIRLNGEEGYINIINIASTRLQETYQVFFSRSLNKI